MTLLALVLLTAAVIAWWSWRRSNAAAEYFAAGHTAGAWLVGVAGTAAAVSGFAFVGGPGLFAMIGVGSLWIILSAPLTGALQCWAVGEDLVESASERRHLTLPSLLADRFSSKKLGASTAIVVTIGCVASLTVQVRAAAVLGEHFLHLPGYLSAIVVMLATTAYTATGGMRAGLLADAIQGGVMALVGVALAIAAVTAAGGMSAILATIESTRPELLGVFGSIKPPQALAWYLLFCLGTCAQPHYLQKFLFLRSPRDLRALPAVLTGTLAATLAVWIGVGLAGTALTARGAITLTKGDDLTPAVMGYLGPWAVFLAGAAVLAAMMSTAASFLSLSAAALTRDLPQALSRQPKSINTARWATVLVAAVATTLGAISDRAVVLLGVMGWGFFTAALLPAMTIGLAWRQARPDAITAGITVGAISDVILEIFRTRLPIGLEPGLAGAAIGALVLVVLSIRRR